MCFQCDYVNPKYGEKTKLYFIVYIKRDDIYKHITEDVYTRFDTYELYRALPKGKVKN